MALRAGAQTGTGEKALVKTTASDDSDSIKGREIVLSPYIGKNSGDWSSATNQIMFGLVWAIPVISFSLQLVPKAKKKEHQMNDRINLFKGF